MKNVDKIKNMETLRAELFASMQTDDLKAQEIAFNNFAEGIQSEIMQQAKEITQTQNVAYTDEQILTNRGLRKPLTSTEKQYFNAVIERKGFEGIEQTFPKTIIEEVFKSLQEEHPILSRIDLKDTAILTQYVLAKPTKAKAFWGVICEDIKQMILQGFDVIDLKSSRLSGFIPVCKGMLELGPNWLADYVTTIIREVMSASLELAIVQGNGKNQPIGMIKKLSGATDSVYPDKTKITINDLKPTSLAGVRGALAEAKTDTGNVAILVHPKTYWAKVFKSLAFQTMQGIWVIDKLATGEEIVKSYAVPEDTLIVGDLNNYLLGVASDVAITRYDQTLAIEDMDLFIAKLYAHGMAKDANAFFVVDIAGVAGETIPALETFTANTGDNKDSIITSRTTAVGV